MKTNLPHVTHIIQRKTGYFLLLTAFILVNALITIGCAPTSSRTPTPASTLGNLRLASLGVTYYGRELVSDFTPVTTNYTVEHIDFGGLAVVADGASVDGTAGYVVTPGEVRDAAGMPVAAAAANVLVALTETTLTLTVDASATDSTLAPTVYTVAIAVTPRFAADASGIPNAAGLDAKLTKAVTVNGAAVPSPTFTPTPNDPTTYTYINSGVGFTGDSVLTVSVGADAADRVTLAPAGGSVSITSIEGVANTEMGLVTVTEVLDTMDYPSLPAGVAVPVSLTYSLQNALTSQALALRLQTLSVRYYGRELLSSFAATTTNYMASHIDFGGLAIAADAVSVEATAGYVVTPGDVIGADDAVITGATVTSNLNNNSLTLTVNSGTLDPTTYTVEITLTDRFAADAAGLDAVLTKTVTVNGAAVSSPAFTADGGTYTHVNSGISFAGDSVLTVRVTEPTNADRVAFDPVGGSVSITSDGTANTETNSVTVTEVLDSTYTGLTAAGVTPAIVTYVLTNNLTDMSTTALASLSVLRVRYYGFDVEVPPLESGASAYTAAKSHTNYGGLTVGAGYEVMAPTPDGVTSASTASVSGNTVTITVTASDGDNTDSTTYTAQTYTVEITLTDRFVIDAAGLDAKLTKVVETNFIVVTPTITTNDNIYTYTNNGVSFTGMSTLTVNVVNSADESRVTFDPLGRSVILTSTAEIASTASASITVTEVLDPAYTGLVTGGVTAVAVTYVLENNLVLVPAPLSSLAADYYGFSLVTGFAADTNEYTARHTNYGGIGLGTGDTYYISAGYRVTATADSAVTVGAPVIEFTTSPSSIVTITVTASGTGYSSQDYVIRITLLDRIAMNAAELDAKLSKSVTVNGTNVDMPNFIIPGDQSNIYKHNNSGVSFTGDSVMLIRIISGSNISRITLDPSSGSVTTTSTAGVFINVEKEVTATENTSRYPKLPSIVPIIVTYIMRTFLVVQ